MQKIEETKRLNEYGEVSRESGGDGAKRGKKWYSQRLGEGVYI